MYTQDKNNNLSTERRYSWWQVHMHKLIIKTMRKIYAFRICTGQRHKPEEYYRQKHCRPICPDVAVLDRNLLEYEAIIASKRWTGCKLQTNLCIHMWPRRLFSPLHVRPAIHSASYCIHPHMRLWIQQQENLKTYFMPVGCTNIRNSKEMNIPISSTPPWNWLKSPGSTAPQLDHDPNGWATGRLRNFTLLPEGVRQYLHRCHLCLHG